MGEKKMENGKWKMENEKWNMGQKKKGKWVRKKMSIKMLMSMLTEEKRKMSICIVLYLCKCSDSEWDSVSSSEKCG